MNSFANSLFSLLFGWARSLIQQLWASASSGKYGGFFTWLGDHWVWLAAILCLCGTAVDFLVWFVRWRPYLAWRTSFRRFFSFFQRIGREDARRFQKGYQGGVALEISQAQADVGEPWAEEPWQEPPARQMEEPVPAPAAPVYFPPQEEAEDARQRRFVPPAYEAPPMVWNGRESSDYAAQPSRRRRAQRYDRRRAEWRERLIKGDEEEDGLLDSLPPAADRQQAFYEPVYPRQNNAQESPYASWRRPGGSDTDGST